MVRSSADVLGFTANADGVALFEALFYVDCNCRALFPWQNPSLYVAPRLVALEHHMHQR